jgi:hypothetical protein
MTTEKSNYEKLAAIDVSKHIEYDKDTGIFKWINCPKKSFNGNVLGTPDKDGYLTAKFMQVRYRLHRLAWYIAYGAFPPDQIDHINGVKTDNRIVNLRLANNSENNCNRTVRNKLGVKGVRKHGKRYQALICKDRKRILLGSFLTITEASAAYRHAAKQLHGEFCHE